MNKVNFLDKNLRKEFLERLSLISTILSLFLIFYDIPTSKKCFLGISFILFLLIFYIILWYRANNLSSINLNINNSEIEIKIGDIFKESGVKVIAFNEYYDTIVDDKIISKKSLNGIFIDKIGNRKLKELDDLIKNDTDLEKNHKLDYNSSRISGKKQKYRLGSILEYEYDKNKEEIYFLTAMTKFDDNNRAILSFKEFINFLLEFWNNIDIKYNNRTIVIPVLGTGITRFKEKIDISDQELLNLIIWTFKLSKIKFTYPSKIKIIVHNSKRDKINFYNLKQLEKI